MTLMPEKFISVKNSRCNSTENNLYENIRNDEGGKFLK